MVIHNNNNDTIYNNNSNNSDYITKILTTIIQNGTASIYKI